MFNPLSHPAFAHHIEVSKNRIKDEMHLEVDHMVNRAYDQALTDLQQICIFDLSRINEQRVLESSGPLRFKFSCHNQSFVLNSQQSPTSFPLSFNPSLNYSNPHYTNMQYSHPIPFDPRSTNQSHPKTPEIVNNGEVVDDGYSDQLNGGTNQVDEESSLLVKRPRMDSIRPNNVPETQPESSGNLGNDEIRELSGYEVSNRLPKNKSTQPPTTNAQQMYFEDDFEISQEILDEVKKEIEEEEEMKQRENEHEGEHERQDDEVGRIGSELSEAIDTQTTLGESFQHSLDKSMAIQPNLARTNSFPCPVSSESRCRLHTGERSFECDKCGKQLRNKIYLKMHQQSHSSERPHKCMLCEMSFAFKDTLNTHVQAIHQRVKPFMCKQCVSQPLINQI